MLPPNFVWKRYNHTLRQHGLLHRCRIPFIRREPFRRSLLRASENPVRSAAPRLLRIPSGKALPPSASLYTRFQVPTPSLHSLCLYSFVSRKQDFPDWSYYCTFRPPCQGFYENVQCFMKIFYENRVFDFHKIKVYENFCVKGDFYFYKLAAFAAEI